MSRGAWMVESHGSRVAGHVHDSRAHQASRPSLKVHDSGLMTHDRRLTTHDARPTTL